MKKISLSLLLFLSFLIFPGMIAREPLISQYEPLPEYNAASFHPAFEITEPPKTVFDIIEIHDDEKEACTIPADISKLNKEALETFHIALSKVPCEYMQSFRNFEIIDDPDMPRALAGKFTLKLRSDSPEKPEFEKLLYHEFGHIVDLGGINGTPKSGESEFKDGSLPIFEDDISLQFYRISWSDSNTEKPGTTPEDFVSGYAAVNPFEDFAESFVLYRYHGNTFEKMAEENMNLRMKYLFMKNYVFDGEEFDTGDESRIMIPRPWDTTKL